MESTEFKAGPDQMIVVYVSADNGMEVDIVALYAASATDSMRRSLAGQRIAAMTSIPVRHAGQFLAKQGSGYETKVTVTVVYASA
jgi:hypothetical protein